MTRAQVERELRTRLAAHRTYINGAYVRLVADEVGAISDTLLPWLMELVEQVEGETREEYGKLP